MVMPTAASTSSLSGVRAPRNREVRCSVPTARTTSCSPARIASDASRMAVAPLLQAFSTLARGIPARPTSARIRWPVTIPWKTWPQ